MLVIVQDNAVRGLLDIVQSFKFDSVKGLNPGVISKVG